MITERPKIIVNEEDVGALQTGDKGEIPFFISPTLNETPLATIAKYTHYAEAEKLIANGGIKDPSNPNNYLLPILQDFFEESLKINREDIGASHVYVKDLGTAAPATATPWTQIIKDAKLKNDVRVEVYVFQKPADATTEAIATLITNVASIMNNVATSLEAEAKKGKPRIAYFTVLGLNDTQLRELTKASNATHIQHSRIYLLEPKDFGKTIARICTTPVEDEPGYYKYRTVEPGHFTERSDEDIDNRDPNAGPLGLQHCGIVINCDEVTNSDIYPRINLCVATSYAKGDERPTDSLLHARRKVDQLQREAVDIVFQQLKRRESSGYLADTQADLDVLVSDKIEAEHMKKGTAIKVVETEDEPEKLAIITDAYPCGITGKITMTTYIH